MFTLLQNRLKVHKFGKMEGAIFLAFYTPGKSWHICGTNQSVVGMGDTVKRQI